MEQAAKAAFSDGLGENLDNCQATAEGHADLAKRWALFRKARLSDSPQ